MFRKKTVIFVGDFGEGRAQLLRKPWVDSSADCVNCSKNARFLQKFPVFPCSLLCGVCVFSDFVCATGRGI